jgi:hypothetical protein
VVGYGSIVLDYVTHYYIEDRGPFRNLSDLSAEECQQVMDELSRERLAGRQHRRFGRIYMEMRRMTKARLRDLFVKAGGEPERSAPHYFVLGQSRWFRGLAANMREVRIPLTSLPDLQTSVTYPDSLTALGVVAEFGLPYQEQPYHGHVFRLGDLADLVERYGVPDAPADADYDGYEQREMEKYIEVQVWTEDVLSLAALTSTRR